jgi:raffinose/stachyose/melibiose transport system permease protein
MEENMINRLRPGKWVMLAYLLPGFLITVCMLILPLLTATGFSFCKFTSIKNITFAGLDNYRTLFADKNVLNSLKNNLFLVGVSLVGQLGIAFLLAMMLNSRLTHLKQFHRTVAYFPVTLSAVVVGYVWSMVFDYNFGLLASMMKALGCGDRVAPWLSQPSTVMICVCIPLIWQYIGFHLVIMLSAMSSIDKEIYEMAEIDGAGELRKAISITLPLIRNTLMVCVFLCISANMKVFDHIIAMTNGGPGYSSSVLAVYTYIISFNNMNFGYGSALSVAIFVVTASLVALSQLLLHQKKEA